MTVTVAVLPPSTVFTVIVAVPGFTPVTTPAAETLATELFEEDHARFLFVAFAGVIVGVNETAPPTLTLVVAGFKLTPVTGWVTVTVAEAVLPPSAVFTVIVALPTALAVTTPVADTVATLVLLEVQITFLFVAFVGVTVAVNDTVSPTLIVAKDWFKLTPVTTTTGGVVTVIVAVSETFTPKDDVLDNVIVAVPADLPVTTPVLDTVATLVLFEDHDRFTSLAYDCKNEDDKETVLPTLTEAVAGLTATDIAGIATWDLRTQAAESEEPTTPVGNNTCTHSFDTVLTTPSTSLDNTTHLDDSVVADAYTLAPCKTTESGVSGTSVCTVIQDQSIASSTPEVTFTHNFVTPS
ncbi:MAG: hypothetical protein FWG47_05590 [Propionibacteriaceae bacterium]|nr:hypothetical protein [Propionibacteriaceae bacterium]